MTVCTACTSQNNTCSASGGSSLDCGNGAPAAGRQSVGSPATSSPASIDSRNEGGSPSTGVTTEASSKETVYLTELTPLQNSLTAFSFKAGPVQMSGQTYRQSIYFTCQDPITSVVYEVTGFKFLDATIGVPDDATNTSGISTTSVMFFKNGSTTQIGQPVFPLLGHPQKIQLNLQGAVQLEIGCATNRNDLADVALGNATLSG